MIPTDLASRLRILIDSEVKALTPIEELKSDLPELETDQRFSAKIESTLPDGSFRATVAGRTVTLSMPGNAKAGDVLELVVTGKDDKTISARLTDPATPASAAAQPRLSPAGQLISQLLTGRHSDAQAATLNRNEPLLPAPPTKAAPLTPLLRQAVSESGLFYEAHQAQWIEGETSLESLLREPQGRTSTTSLQNPAQGSPAPTADESGHASQTAQHTPPQGAVPQTGDANSLVRNPQNSGIHPPDAERAAADNAQAPHSTALKIAEQLMPIVHQQLDTLATHQALWQGQVWPGQTMQWEIFDPEGQSQPSSEQGDGSEPPPWQSTLRLQMPRLGGIEVQIVVTAAGVAIRVNADSAQAAEQLQSGSEALGNALEAAGVPMTGFAVQQGGAREAGI